MYCRTVVLAALAAIANMEQMTTLLIYRDDYIFESSGSPYTQITVHSTRFECSAMCLRQNCAGMSFNKTSRQCSIYLSFSRVILGSGNIYISEGQLLQMLRDDGFFSLGGERFVKIVQSEGLNASLAVDLCTPVFAFANLFVPKSLTEMELLTDFCIQNGLDNKQYLIGLGDGEVEGTAKWSDGSAYTGLISPIMHWKRGVELAYNDLMVNSVTTKLKSDLSWETMFKDPSDGVICEVDIN